MLETTISAPGMTTPVASATEPLRLLEPDWASAAEAISPAANARLDAAKGTPLPRRERAA